MRSRIDGVALATLLASGSIIGLSTVMAGVAQEEGMSSLAYLTWSLLGASVLLVARAVVRDRVPRVDRGTIRYFLIAGFVSLAAPNMVLFTAVPEVGASYVSLAIAFPPLLTYLGALALGMERLDVVRAAGVAAALAGSVLLTVFALGEPDAPVVWILGVLVAPVLLAVGNIYRTADWPPGAAAEELAPGMLVGAVLILLPVGLLPGFSLSVPSTATAHALIAALSVLFAVLYLCFFVLQERGGPVYLSLLGSVAAVVGSAVAIVVLGEEAPAGLLPSGLLVAVGVGLLTWGSNRGRRDDHPMDTSREPAEAGVSR